MSTLKNKLKFKNMLIDKGKFVKPFLKLISKPALQNCE